MDDVGVPANYREMPGFGVHTYTLINREGKVHYVKFHWLPKAGMLLAPFGVASLACRSSQLLPDAILCCSMGLYMGNLTAAT